VKKKTFWISISLVVIVGLFLWWFLFKLKPETKNLPISSPCLIFQNSDSKLPCYRIDVDKTVYPTSTSTSLIPKTPQNEPIYGCFGENSIETNGCISDIALEKKDSSLCSYVQGQYSQAQCKERVINPKSQIINTQVVETKVSPLNLFTPPSSTLAPIIFTNSDVLNKISVYQTELEEQARNDDRFTAAGFYKRMQESASLSLFSFSEYQIKPGATLVANGIGFAKSGNIIHIGNYEINNLSSVDGVTISFTLPTDAPLGNHEAWVTNNKGTSKKDNQPIRVVITDNPAPRPIIKSVSPMKPSIRDSVTLYGENLSGVIGLYTSLGVLQGLSSTDSSVSFKVSDFEMVSKIKDADFVKGNVVQVYVIVATDKGFNKDMFVFDVQF
jgi:hypothetical protein